MARTEWNFMREVKPPAQVRCRIEVVRVGRASLVHAVRIFDLSQPDDAPRKGLAGTGQVTHVYVERATKSSLAWPPELLAAIWSGAPLPGAPVEAPSP
jgi:acyl-CoA thioesterase FadM